MRSGSLRRGSSGDYSKSAQQATHKRLSQNGLIMGLKRRPGRNSRGGETLVLVIHQKEGEGQRAENKELKSPTVSGGAKAWT